MEENQVGYLVGFEEELRSQIAVAKNKDIKPSYDPPKLRGTLRIITDPAGANIFVNGKATSSLEKGVMLEPGEYQVTIDQPGFIEIRERITVLSNQLVEKSYKLDVLSKPKGMLQIITSPPGASVYANGKPIGSSGQQITLEPGNYTIKVMLDGYLEITDQLEVLAGQLKERRYALALISTEPLKSNADRTAGEMGAPDYKIYSPLHIVRNVWLTIGGKLKKGETIAVNENITIKYGIALTGDLYATESGLTFAYVEDPKQYWNIPWKDIDDLKRMRSPGSFSRQLAIKLHGSERQYVFLKLKYPYSTGDAAISIDSFSKDDTNNLNVLWEKYKSKAGLSNKPFLH